MKRDAVTDQWLTSDVCSGCGLGEVERNLNLRRRPTLWGHYILSESGKTGDICGDNQLSRHTRLLTTNSCDISRQYTQGVNGTRWLCFIGLLQRVQPRVTASKHYQGGQGCEANKVSFGTLRHTAISCTVRIRVHQCMVSVWPLRGQRAPEREVTWCAVLKKTNSWKLWWCQLNDLAA